MNTSETQNQEPIIAPEEVIISPHECSTKGGEHFTATFPHPLSTDTILLLLQGSVDCHKLICQRDDDYTVSVTLPAHSLAEVVDVALYRLPSDQDTLDHTYHPQLLVKDQIIYTDISHYLAELLVQSVTDGTQAFYSMLPPLSSLDLSGLQEFDLQLANALQEVDLPDGWSLMSEKQTDNETLLHFAARNRLLHLFSTLVALPGGRQALSLTNAEGKVPLDLAQENGVQEVIDIINGLNEPLLQEDILPMEVEDEFLSQLQLMKDIDLEWIQKQRNSEGNNPSILRTPIPRQLSLPGFTFRCRSSIGVMEGRSSVSVTKEDSPSLSSILDVLMLHESDRKSWSRIVGDSRTRSVGTGMNELDRLTVGRNTPDDRKNHQISSHHHTKGVWLGRWSISCPILDESIISDLIYSTLTSPGTTENSFLPDFALSTTKQEDHTHLNESTTPHQALLTLSTGSEVSSTSPSVLFPIIPAVCIEDPNQEIIFPDSPVKATPTNDDSTQQATKDSFSELPNLVTSSGEDEEEDEIQDLPFNYPLLSKSAPAISIKNEASPHSGENVIAKPKSHSISEQGDRHVDDDYIDPSYSRVPTTPTTPVTTPIIKRSHKKSQSMSGVVFHDLELEDSLEVAETESHTHETEPRSHGSSFISTSSKQATSSSSIDDEDDEDDNHYVTASENDLQSKSPSSLLSPSSSSIEKSYLVPLSKDPDKSSVDTLNSHSEEMTSGDDIVDGSETREGRGRRYSLNVITNVDDYNASSEDEAESKEKPFKKSSTVSENLSTFDTPTHQTSGETEIGEKTEEELEVKLLPKPTEDVTSSDIDVKLGSLNNSFSAPQGVDPTSITPTDKTSPLEVGRSESEPTLQRSSPLIFPGQKVKLPSSTGGDAKQAISMLKTLIEMDRSGLESAVFPVKETGADRLKSLAQLISHPVSLPSEPGGLSASFNTHGPRSHTKVSRNSSSASDTAVVLGHAEVPTVVASSSSLDFVQSPDGGRTSPRSISYRETSPHPQSPLFISKSPLSTSPQQIDDKVPSPPRSSLKVSPNSPLEKKAKSVDNLLHSDDQKTVPGKHEEERAVRMNVRFETDELPTCQGPVVVRREQHKDIQSYLGILEPSTEVKEPPRKGISKLFRRDSKKEKRKTRENSTSSLDTTNISNHDDKVVKEKNKANPPLQTLISQPGPSPEKRNKTRSQTIHGDMNLSEPENKELRSLIHTQLKEGASSIPENEQLPRLSPPPPQLSPTETTSQLELDDTSLSISIDEHPLLLIENEPDTSWYRTIDRRLRRSINKHERGRQGAIFDWIRTERHIYRSIVILKVVFRDKLSSELGMTEDLLDQLFPSLNELLEVSKDFSNKLQSRQRKSSLMIDDISDILLSQFAGDGGDKMRVAYTGFICRQAEAIELYRDLERKRHKFLRLMNALYQNKYCERRKLPDFYLLLTQRVAKYVEMMKKLLKETETLKLEHLDRLKKTSVALQNLVKAIDQGVEDYNNQKELDGIQSRLEIQIPRNSKNWAKIKGLKHLDLRAQNRQLIKTGDANWQSQGKQLAVHLVLVTDLIIFLTERDQKYHLATLHDLKPPVIPLFDLLVRLNASVRSGVQLLLLEQGDRPEMFRIEFQTKKLAKEWEETLNKAVENCKIKGLKCEHFGSEVVLSGDEAKDEEDEEYDKDPDPLPDLSPNSVQRLMIQHALDQASSLLFSSTPTLTNSTDSSATRHSIAVVRSNSPQISTRNKPNRSTTFYSSKAQSVDVVDPKFSKNKKVPERGQSFLDKKGAATAVVTVPSKDTVNDKEKQMYLECIGRLKESVEYLMEQNESHVQTIANLKEDIRDLKEQRTHDSITQSSPVLPRPPSRRTSLKNRPHSIHSDLFESDHSDFSEDRRSPLIRDHIHGSINHWNH